MKKRYILLFTGLALGLSWANRGHFGHEWGASWAGAAGVMALIAILKKKEWIQNLPVLTLLGGIGWGAAGMASYGILIGYCYGNDFLNVSYGYTMLAIVGGLYGFIGGGFLGLGLETSEEKRPNWPALLTQMVAGGILFWGFFIYQLEWFMTPPRSELWAACFGGCIALFWYLYREGFHGALRVACYTALGAGFGFTVGNFIQLNGHLSDVSYNWWNVMEFTLGFCGGTGMAYAVSTGTWPKPLHRSKRQNLVALLIIFLIFPFINFVEGFTKEYFYQELPERLGIENIEGFIHVNMSMLWLLIILAVTIAIIAWKKMQKFPYQMALLLVFIISLHYTLFSYFRNGMFYKGLHWEHSETMYLVILLAMGTTWFLNKRNEGIGDTAITRPGPSSGWIKLLVALVVVILVITAISLNIHDGLPNASKRF